QHASRSGLRHPSGRCDLFEATVAVVVPIERLTLLGGKASDRLAHEGAKFPANQAFFGRRIARSERVGLPLEPRPGTGRGGRLAILLGRWRRHVRVLVRRREARRGDGPRPFSYDSPGLPAPTACPFHHRIANAKARPSRERAAILVV